MKPVFSAFAFAITLCSTGTIVAAQDVCMPSEELTAGLVDWYGEHPAHPPTGDNRQVWVSGVTGTWSIVVFLADGNACTVAQGDDWIGQMPTAQTIASLE